MNFYLCLSNLMQEEKWNKKHTKKKKYIKTASWEIFFRQFYCVGLVVVVIFFIAKRL